MKFQRELVAHITFGTKWLLPQTFVRRVRMGRRMEEKQFHGTEEGMEQ